MIRTRLLQGAAMALAAALTLSACGRSEAPDTHDNQSADTKVRPGAFPNEPTGEPVTGGTLSFADSSEPRTLDPSLVISTGASGGSALVAIYDQLVRYDLAAGEYQPRVAESVEPNDDFTEWTITIRPGVTFSDGTPLDADAVIGSMNWYTGTQSFEMAVLGPLWGGVEKVDDLTVKVTLLEPWAMFESMLARSLGFIVAPAAIEGGTFSEPIGAGAFTLDRYAPTEELILQANPNHWDGAPYIDTLRFVWLGDDRTAYESLEGDSVHAAYIQESDLVHEVFETNQPHVTLISNLGQLLMVNHAEGNPGSYPAARKAMAYALDPDVIGDRVFDGYGVSSKMIFSEISRWYDDSVEVNDYDPEAGEQQLAEAKAAGYDGKVELLAVDTPAGRESMLLIKGQLEAVGFEVETEMLRSVADYISRLYVERNFSVTDSGLSLQEQDPWMGLFLGFHSESHNVSGVNDPELDALIDELRVTPLEDAQDVITRIEEHFQEIVPAIPYRPYTPTTVWSEDVYGVVGLNETMVDFGKAWIAE